MIHSQRKISDFQTNEQPFESVIQSRWHAPTLMLPVGCHQAKLLAI